VALAVVLRSPGTAGTLALGAAVASLLLGELVAPAALRRALSRAGELPAAPPERARPGEAPPPGRPEPSA